MGLAERVVMIVDELEALEHTDEGVDSRFEEEFDVVILFGVMME